MPRQMHALSASSKPKTPTVKGAVPPGATILIVREPWLSHILNGRKTLEVRGTPCRKPVGTKVFLALSGAGGLIYGSVVFAGTRGPMSAREFNDAKAQHLVANGRPYGSATHGWKLTQPKKFFKPVKYTVKKGCVVWAKMA